MDSAIRLRMEKPLVERVDGLRQTFLFLGILVVPYVCSGNRSRKLPGIGKEDRVVKGVGQHRQVRLGQRKDAGRILETAGSTSDLEGQSALCLSSREIDAILSLREIDLQ